MGRRRMRRGKGRRRRRRRRISRQAAERAALDSLRGSQQYANAKAVLAQAASNVVVPDLESGQEPTTVPLIHFTLHVIAEISQNTNFT